LEARCYLSLVEKGEQTGYEVAKNISSSRSNVYASLNSLSKKGACRMIENKSTFYVAVPIGELISKLQLEFKQSATILNEEIKKQEDNQKRYNFYNTQGLEAIQSVIKRCIAHTEEEIIIDVDTKEANYFLPLLEEAENQGIKVTLITLEEVETTLKNVVVDMSSGKLEDSISSFSILFDQKKVVIGSLDERIVPSAVETKHPALIQEVKLSIRHDMVMERIKKDFGKQLIETYGQDFFDLI
jgi:sugar-specific transcriptional regulator TrmB